MKNRAERSGGFFFNATLVMGLRSLILEYFKKDKRLDFRLERLG
jgi:hypothetical protein